MARLFGRLGIGPDDTVVLYGEPVQFGTYAYWAFTMAGHRDLRLLDGGRRKWIQEKRPLSRTVPAFAPVEYPPPAPNASMRVGRDEVRARLGHPHQLLLLICLAMVPLLFLMRLRQAMWHPGGCATASRACTCTDEGKIGATKAIDAKTSCSATLFGAAAVPDAACRCHCRVNPCTSGSELISHFGGGTTKGVPCSVF